MPGMGPGGPGGPGGFGGHGPHGGPHGHGPMGHGGPMGPMGGPMGHGGPMGPIGPMGRPMGPMGPMGRSALGPGFYGGLYAQKGAGPVVEDDTYKVETRTVKVIRDDGSVVKQIQYVNKEYERYRKSLWGRVVLWFRRTFHR